MPLFWKALPKKGNSNSDERIELLEKFIKTFGGQRISSLLADRAFVGKPWIDYFIKQKIIFLIRIKQNRLVEWEDGTRPIGDFFLHLKGRQKDILPSKFKSIPYFLQRSDLGMGRLSL